MKIKIEGAFKRMLLDIETAQAQGDPIPQYAQDYLNSLKRDRADSHRYPQQPPEKRPVNNNDPWQQFVRYVNKGRSPWCIRQDNSFTGTSHQLDSFIRSFTKSHPTVVITYTQQLRGGEYIPVITDISDIGGDIS